MKQKTNNLDERQEQILLKIERNGCWLAFWGLFAVMMVQMMIFGYDHFLHIIGETIVFFALAVYLVVDCLRNGIWDRRLKADPKTNLLLSLIGGACAGLVVAVTNFVSYGDFLTAVLAFAITGVFTMALCYGFLTLSMKKYKKRKEQLEESYEEDSTEA